MELAKMAWGKSMEGGETIATIAVSAEFHSWKRRVKTDFSTFLRRDHIRDLKIIGTEQSVELRSCLRNSFRIKVRKLGWWDLNYQFSTAAASATTVWWWWLENTKR